MQRPFAISVSRAMLMLHAMYINIVLFVMSLATTVGRDGLRDLVTRTHTLTLLRLYVYNMHTMYIFVYIYGTFFYAY